MRIADQRSTDARAGTKTSGFQDERQHCGRASTRGRNAQDVVLGHVWVAEQERDDILMRIHDKALEDKAIV